MKRILVGICILVSLITVNGCTKINNGNDEAIKPVYKQITEDKKEQTLEGTIVDCTMNIVVLKNDNGDTYEFYKGDLDKDSKLADMQVGNTIKVTYSGNLQSNDPMEITVIKLENA